MERLSIIKRWISNLLTFYSGSPKNTSFNEKNIKKVHEEKILKTEQGIFTVKTSNEDNITLDLCDLNITLSRFINSDIPHEVSIFVPRAEIRKTLKNGFNKEYTSEVILNSITIVHSPSSKKEEPEKKETPKEIPKSSADTNIPKTQIGFKC